MHDAPASEPEPLPHFCESSPQHRGREEQKRISFLFRRRRRHSGVHTLSIPECHVLSACGFFRFDTKWRRLLDAAVDQCSAPPEHHINSGMRGTHTYCSPVSLARQYPKHPLDREDRTGHGRKRTHACATQIIVPPPTPLTPGCVCRLWII